MKRLSMRTWIVLAFGTLAMLVFFSAAFAVTSLTGADQRFRGYVGVHGETIALASAVRRAVNSRAVHARNLVLVDDPADIEQEYAASNRAHAAMVSALAALRAAIGSDEHTTNEERAYVSRLVEIESRYGPVALRIVELARAGDKEAARRVLVDECRPLLEELVQIVGDYNAYSEGRSDVMVDKSHEAFVEQRRRLAAICLLAVAGALGLGLLIIRRLNSALGAEPTVLRDAVQRVAGGDLSPVAGVASAPSGSVLESLGGMQQQLVALIRQVRAAAQSIASASAQLADDNTGLADRTNGQAQALEQNAASMTQLDATVKENASNARQADALAKEASEVATRGGAVVNEVVETMRGITDSSQQIADILGVIDSIAFQTNILALNAAVEAARAGEQGRGFAVVASEVRTLAQRSTGAAREIKDLVSTSVASVEQGAAKVDEAGTTIRSVVSVITEVATLMSGITVASAEQSAGVSQVGEVLVQMDQGTQRNAALVRQSTERTGALRDQARELVEAVSVFQVPEGEPLARTA